MNSKQESLDEILESLVLDTTEGYNFGILPDEPGYDKEADINKSQRGYILEETKAKLQAYCNKQVIEELERISCCDYNPVSFSKEPINVCNGDHLARIKELKEQE